MEHSRPGTSCTGTLYLLEKWEYTKLYKFAHPIMDKKSVDFDFLNEATDNAYLNFETGKQNST